MGSVPTLRDIRAELVILRQYQGIRYSWMSKAPQICSLPVVLRELEIQQRDRREAGVVAYDVMECVTSSAELLSEQNGMILSETLNFRSEDSILEARRSKVMGRLGVHSLDSYLQMEERAYELMAGLMLRIPRSPCTDDNRPGKLDAKVRADVAAMFDLEAVHLLEQVLARLGFSRSRAESLSKAEEILRRLPTALAVFDAQNPADASGLTTEEKVVEILSAAAFHYYEAWTRVVLAGSKSVDIPRFDVVAVVLSFRLDYPSFGERDRQLARSLSERMKTWRERSQEEVPPFLGLAQPGLDHLLIATHKSGRGKPSRGYYEMRDASMRVFAQLLQSIELNNDWPRILKFDRITNLSRPFSPALI